jgi:DNA polymerase III gamma/tau subunit
VEFSAGIGEVLRALFMVQVGVTPEGLTEPLRQVLANHAGRLPPGDLLRMLKLLGESEGILRRAANPRLAIETLLLRWTLMDRTVDLEAVLAGRSPAPPSGTAPAAPIPPHRSRTASPAPATTPVREAEAAPGATPTAAGEIEFSQSGLEAAWPEIIGLARARSRFLGEALAGARPSGVAPPELSLEIGAANPIHRETLTRQREAVEQLLGEATGRPVRLVLVEAGPNPGQAGRARRLSDAEARAERLRVLRTRDPALEAAAESLDLEVLE